MLVACCYPLLRVWVRSFDAPEWVISDAFSFGVLVGPPLLNFGDIIGVHLPFGKFFSKFHLAWHSFDSNTYTITHWSWSFPFRIFVQIVVALRAVVCRHPSLLWRRFFDWSIDAETQWLCLFLTIPIQKKHNKNAHVSWHPWRRKF